MNALFGVVCETEIFAGYKFRRQHPIDPYILDFYCPAAKPAIELDGSGHGYLLCETGDHARDEFLASMEITVLRFRNHQVREEFDIPHLHPLPFTKGEAPQKRRGVIRSRFTDRESDSCEIQRDIAL